MPDVEVDGGGLVVGAAVVPVTGNVVAVAFDGGVVAAAELVAALVELAPDLDVVPLLQPHTASATTPNATKDLGRGVTHGP